ncbi:uncharacterized protein ARB_07021 [Trichophyton benhamiae CBS 112371]|uniref:Major facilitator superfamily (MFS) profile domain-containing protein n=1 Tax=Arthroderma benhamiae (strain ATCC MYA-4681 / CBS 112371) TaxID=663331 RepID=D4AS06_ARTBC|nr:uncharacterized protein ARB_07021 [Trichophyton benhamiae CBS 112371]EFE34070.1 hypothetical protein ARB_07021 [Trichophyton benhamiae CBS 112371]
MSSPGDTPSSQPSMTKLEILPTIGENNLQALLEEHGLEYTPDGEHIRWLASNPKHPRNWSMLRKIYDSGLIIILDLFTTAVSTAGPFTLIIDLLSWKTRYLLGQGVGGIIFPPYSESFGRKKLYIVSTGLYSLFCVVVGLVPSVAGVIVGRFFSGFLSAIPTIVVAGSIEDIFNSKDRIWLIFMWAMVANMGLILGPIMSIYIIDHLDWPSLLLSREVAKLKKSTGITTLKALNPDHTPDMKTFARIALFRPLKLFFTEPIVFMVATISAVAFALIYLFTEALPPIYEDLGFSSANSSLPFLAIGIGLISGVLTRIFDHRMITRYQREGKVLQPEHKLVGFSIGAPVLAVGLWWFAWTIPPRVPGVHWVVSAISLVLIGYALNEFDAVLAGYLADSYLSYSASGFAALSLVRSTLSAVFPLFAGRMYEVLGANLATSILAALATVFCIIPPLFTRYGPRIRARSKFARYSLQVYQENGVDKDGY